MSSQTSGEIKLKLRTNRILLIGFAFFGILLLWQVYDSWCPTFLTDIFARRMYSISSAVFSECKGFTSFRGFSDDTERICRIRTKGAVQ